MNFNLHCLFVFGATAPPPSAQWASASSLTRFLDHAQQQSVGLLWTSDQLVALSFYSAFYAFVVR